jgi:hypothetical protein
MDQHIEEFSTGYMLRNFIKIFKSLLNNVVGRVAVGTANSYGMECPGIESRWERDFTHLSRPALGPNQHPVQ